MKKVVYGKKIYYSDELNDDFSDVPVKTIKITDNYEYLPKTIFGKIFSFLLTYLIAIPYLFLEAKFKHRVKVEGRENVKSLKGGYVLYGNHSLAIDAWTPQVLISRPHKTYIISHPDAVSIPFVRHLTKSLGALPLPETVKGSIKFLKTIEHVLKKSNVIAVFPEGHIWPHYTKIRPFGVTSFQYASRFKVPAVPFACTYRAPTGWRSKYQNPHMTIHIGKPIYCDPALDYKENAKMMHQLTMNFMKSHVEQPNNLALYDYVKTIKKQ